LGLEWQVERDPNFEWAQVIRTDPYRDTAEKLAQIIKLNSTQAFGENGWLKKRKGAVTNLETFDHEDKKTCQFAVPNVFTVQVGSQSGAAANEIKGLADNLLRQKGFFINGNGIGSSTYGVLYIGHFYGGTFSSNGDTGDIDSNTILNLTGGLRQIAYFGGFGCFTINHDWRRAVAFPSMDITLWQTNYGLTPSLFYLSKLDTKPRKNKFDIEAERQIGSDGPSLNSWINQIHGN